MTRHRLSLAVSILLIALVATMPTLATTVTPVKYNKWRQDQAVAYMWKADARPPAWMRPAVVAGANDAGETSQSRAATFDLTESAGSWIGYMDQVCTESAIGCAWNNAPNSFSVRLRPQGWSFDWGTLRWCQFYETAPEGCFDAETITLHELGHIQSLGHTEDDASDSWLDSVMHGLSRAKPKSGWNAHAFGRCDVAALQTAYQPAASSTAISTCLSLRTNVTLSAPGSAAYRSNVKFTATLTTADDVSYPKLRGLPLSSRSVQLERRYPGTTTWYSVGQMAPTTTDGQYTLTQSLATTFDWRVTFAAPAGEGLLADNSSIVRVTVAECTSGCPFSFDQ